MLYRERSGLLKIGLGLCGFLVFFKGWGSFFLFFILYICLFLCVIFFKLKVCTGISG